MDRTKFEEKSNSEDQNNLNIGVNQVQYNNGPEVKIEDKNENNSQKDKSTDVRIISFKDSDFKVYKLEDDNTRYFSCDICKIMFKQKSIFKVHMQTFHKKNIQFKEYNSTNKIDKIC